MNQQLSCPDDSPRLDLFTTQYTINNLRQCAVPWSLLAIYPKLQLRRNALLRQFRVRSEPTILLPSGSSA